ncbi:MAG: NADP oxidoreductase [Granulosicoccus sp.]|nr:NADP oxidoreductase [Granulosicoccus sp.]
MQPTDSGSDSERQIVELVVKRYDSRKDALVQILREVQAETHWLSRKVLHLVAAAVGLTPARVEGVASFYHFFHLQPVGRYHFLWSDNVIDRMLGSRMLARELCRLLHIVPGKPRQAAPASLDFTSCTGLGDQGPAVLLNQHQVLTRLDELRVVEIAELVHARVPIEEWPGEWQRVDDQLRRPDVLLASPAAQGEALRATLARGAEATLDEIVISRLRGRGGAGFSTATKWRACLHSPCPAHGGRVVVCNADEGEPGTFKDRVLLTRQADAVFEGMTVAARVIGATEGLVYLRGEYRYMLETLQSVLEQRRRDQLLGRQILGVDGFNFDLDIHVGAGAYVCGEESALIESLEGKRGTPRIRPPFPVERGYLDRPTVVNNVETFCAVTRIAQRGGAWWSAIGTAQSSGTKIHSVSGDCARPGIYEYPFGVSIAQILEDCGANSGAHHAQAVQVGGPSGLCLATDEFERCIGFEDVPTAGAFMVFDETRDMFETARGFAHFFAHESCGFCTPCRVGTELVVRRMDKLAKGHGSIFDETELRELESLLHGTTHCGLGATATNPLRDTLARFRPAYEQRLKSPTFTPGFDLDAELAAARRVTGRDDADAHLVWQE